MGVRYRTTDEQLAVMLRLGARRLRGKALMEELAAHGIALSWSVVRHHLRKVGLWVAKPPTPENRCATCATGIPHQRRYCSAVCRTAAREQRNEVSEASHVMKGYRVVSVPPSERRLHRGIKNGRYALEHVFIVERVLGRKMRRHEVVHHINGNKLDNRKSNLLVCDTQYHAWLHQDMSRRYAREHFGEAA